jgi:tryptophan-rich sensory protein
MKDWMSLAGFIALVAIAAAGGAIAAPDAWFAALAKPSFNPPSWVFAPVWSILYVLMAIAAWRIRRAAGWGIALWLWLAQLFCNAIWAPLFFRMHRIDLALADIFVLLALVVATTWQFYRRDRVAGLLLFPYVAWVGFATALNYAIWTLNGAG